MKRRWRMQLDAIRRYEPSNRTLWVYKSLERTHTSHTGKSSNDLTNLDTWWGRFEIPRTHLDQSDLGCLGCDATKTVNLELSKTHLKSGELNMNSPDDIPGIKRYCLAKG